MTTLYSTHTFMFPFKWDIIANDDYKINIPLKDRTDISEFEKKLFDSNPAWQAGSRGFQIQSAADYNEYTYFYDFVCKVIYDYKDLGNQYDIMRYYEHDLSEGSEYRITSPEKEYILLLTGISLHIFNTGIGILTFNTENRNPLQQLPEDILMINELGRRIYPQFLNEKDVNPKATTKVKRAFLATEVSISLGGTPPTILKDDFSSYDEIHKLHYLKSFIPPNFIYQLFNPTKPIGINDTFSFERKEKREGKVRVLQLVDDRMFTVSWYGNDDLANKLGKLSQEGKLHESNWLYCYTFGDKDSPSVANANMQRQHIDAHTYQRWSDYGTVFGITRDTFVSVSSAVKTLQSNNAPDLSIHTKTMYYQMAMLCLAQRASILRFGGEISNISQLSKMTDTKHITKRVKVLYQSYIEFINKIYFREVTSQIQGIELYDILQDKMRIERDVKNLDEEMSELHSFSNLLENEAQTQEAHQLTKIATMFLVPTFIASLFGLSNFPLIFSYWLGPNPSNEILKENENWYKGFDTTFSIIIIFVLGFSIAGVWLWYQKKKHSNK